MLQVARWRIILVLLATVLAIIFAAPNVLPENVRNTLPSWINKTINLGLDLRGGSQLLLEVDTVTLRRQQLDNIADQMATVLRDAEPAIRYTGRGVVGNAARVRLVDPTQMSRALQALRPLAQSNTSSNAILEFSEGEGGLIEARMTPASLRELSRQAAQQSIEVIRRRIDPDGTAEISISRQGDDRIAVQAPGVTDPEQLRSRIGQTALMTFHLVREVSPEEAAAGRLPPGTMLVQPYPQIGDRPEVVERRPRLTGEHLTRANPSTDQQTAQFVLAFQLDSEGSLRFCRITREYVNQRFAILLDNQVLTAPTINEPICGGSGQIIGQLHAGERQRTGRHAARGRFAGAAERDRAAQRFGRAWPRRDRRGPDLHRDRVRSRSGVHGARLWPPVRRHLGGRARGQRRPDHGHHDGDRRGAHVARALRASSSRSPSRSTPTC